MFVLVFEGVKIAESQSHMPGTNDEKAEDKISP